MSQSDNPQVKGSIDFSTKSFSPVSQAFSFQAFNFSYQWLQKLSEDTTIALLRQISQEINHTAVSPPNPFEVSSSVVRMNTLWLLRLMIALVDALFSLLCKQRLQEHLRPTHTRTAEEAITLRWLRSQSLEKWRVPTILATLPMLLALAFFPFAEFLEFLRTRREVPSAVSTILVTLATFFYLGTTIFPGFDILRRVAMVQGKLEEMQGLSLSALPTMDLIGSLPAQEYICPYKSPQAWASFQSIRYISRLLRYTLELYSRAIIKSFPDDSLQESDVTEANTSSVISFRLKDALRFLSRMHTIILKREITLQISWEDDDQRTRAMSANKRLHQLPENHFNPVDHAFPHKKLKRALSNLLVSPTASELDFQISTILQKQLG
ncbi:hypothetical protein PQX77_016234 [Marasmius sp. AFHP31]|nr:hypothetical protein PQX77_016234 [Marasmius sp. AFHP31]